MSVPRKPLELRPVKIERALLPHQDGSASFAFGPVRALAAIGGPSEVRIRDERTDRAALQIHFTPLQGIAGTSATAFEHALSGIWTYALQLHLYPRALIQLHLQTYSSPSALLSRPFRRDANDESAANLSLDTPPVQAPHPDAPIPVALKAAHINASTMACVDAAINMRCLVAAASAAVVRKDTRANRMRGWRAGEEALQRDVDGDTILEEDGKERFEIILDPSPYEESVARSVHTFAFAFERMAIAPSDDNDEDRLRSHLVYSESQGVQEKNDFNECLTLCRQASQDIVVRMREHIENN